MPKPSPSPLLQSLTTQLPEMVSTLRRYVEHESPSAAPEAIAALVSLIALDFAPAAGAASVAAYPTRTSSRSATPHPRQRQQPERPPSPRTRLHKFPGLGPALQIDFAAPRRVPRILLLGHTDTVFPIGTLAAMPWRENGPRLYGPGAFDMKGGIVQALFALRALAARGPLPCHVTLLLVPDEEIGSPASHSLTRRLAHKADAVLVLEPAAGSEGACKTARKGVARYTLRVHGHATHAGLDFERGASAIVEAAHQVLAISALSQPERGLTLNPGLISGGSRSNVVAAHAEIVIDLRFRTASQAARADAALHRLCPRDPRCRLELHGGVERPPFERSKETVRLYRLASHAANQLGFPLAEASVGGGSDGNLTAALGIPTLDGLGAVGDHAHSPNEFVLARQMPRRAALLAHLIESLSTA